MLQVRIAFRGASSHLTSTTDLDPTLLYHCDKCSKDISGIVRIKCAVCPDFDLCVECFAAGAELQDHRSDHDYTVQVFFYHFSILVTSLTPLWF
jgi:hypothetical protein